MLEGNFFARIGWRADCVGLRAAGRFIQAQAVCRTFWGRAFGGSGNDRPDGREQRERVRGDRGALDARGHGRILRVCVLRVLGDDAHQAAGKAGDARGDARMVRDGVWNLVDVAAMISSKVHIDSSAWKRTKWYEYAARFFFGGLITAITGMIAKKFGPGVAGLFLAFPAIFPASATLIEKHETQKKQRAGIERSKRGRVAAGVDAAGTAMGCVGLFVFAVMVWKLLPRQPAPLVLAEATFAWLVVAVSLWTVCEKMRAYRR